MQILSVQYVRFSHSERKFITSTKMKKQNTALLQKAPHALAPIQS